MFTIQQLETFMDELKALPNENKFVFRDGRKTSKVSEELKHSIAVFLEPMIDINEDSKEFKIFGDYFYENFHRIPKWQQDSLYDMDDPSISMLLAALIRSVATTPKKVASGKSWLPPR